MKNFLIAILIFLMIIGGVRAQVCEENKTKCSSDLLMTCDKGLQWVLKEDCIQSNKTCIYNSAYNPPVAECMCFNCKLPCNDIPCRGDAFVIYLAMFIIFIMVVIFMKIVKDYKGKGK